MQIERVTLSSRKIEAQREFYGDLLGLPTQVDEAGLLHVQIGRSELLFRHDPTVTPFYHFAFRVLTNQPEAAGAWARQRFSLLPDEGQEVFTSRLWNGATQFYFADADGNVVEFLTQESSAAAAFGPDQICHITEMGLPVSDVLATVARLEQALGQGRKNGESATFNPVGDADGALIIVPTGRNWYPTQRPGFSLSVQIELRAAIAEPIELAADQYRILARPLSRQ